MRALVVHESLYGNTRAVAQEIAAGLAASRGDLEVWCRAAADVAVQGPAALAGFDLLVLGCPTHAWGMSSTRSRTAQIAKDAANDAAKDAGHDADGRTPAHDPGAAGAGLRELLAVGLGAGQRVAAFDTRTGSRFAGGAAPRIVRAARRAGGTAFGEPAGFVVTGTAGPLRDGEEARARAWGAALGVMLASVQHVH
jgi:hypothetical protein